MFSPILAMVSAIDSATVKLPALAALIFSTSVPTSSATSAIISTRPWNRSLRATKSVSELTSTMTPFGPFSMMPIRPSAATRPAFLAAFNKPLVRSQSTAAWTSPEVSPSAALQSIIPAPVMSRSSLTICAEIFAIVPFRSGAPASAGDSPRGGYSAVSSLALATQPWTRPGNPTSSPTL